MRLRERSMSAVRATAPGSHTTATVSHFVAAPRRHPRPPLDTSPVILRLRTSAQGGCPSGNLRDAVEGS